jgi:outer membrane protein OmpA-like peptidoglycan-associated protein
LHLLGLGVTLTREQLAASINKDKNMQKQDIRTMSLRAMKIGYASVIFGAAIGLSACHGAAWQCGPKVVPAAPMVEAPPAPEPTPPPAPVPTPPPPAALCLDGEMNVYFHTDKWDVSAADNAKLGEIGLCLSKNADQKVDAEGWADRRAGIKYNIVLSQHRSDAVKKVLESKGVAGSAIISKGNGKTESFAKGGAADALQKNRVVVVKVSR